MVARYILVSLWQPAYSMKVNTVLRDEALGRISFHFSMRIVYTLLLDTLYLQNMLTLYAITY
jgi:hypothetical protein